MKKIHLTLTAIATLGLLAACSSDRDPQRYVPIPIELTSTAKTVGTMPVTDEMLDSVTEYARQGETSEVNGLSLSRNADGIVDAMTVTSEDGASLTGARFGSWGYFGLQGDATPHVPEGGTSARFTGQYEYGLSAREFTAGAPSETGSGNFKILLDLETGTGTMRSAGDLDLRSDNLRYDGDTGQFTGDLSASHIGGAQLDGTASGMTVGAGGNQVLGIFGAENADSVLFGGFYGWSDPNG